MASQSKKYDDEAVARDHAGFGVKAAKYRCGKPLHGNNVDVQGHRGARFLRTVSYTAE